MRCLSKRKIVIGMNIKQPNKPAKIFCTILKVISIMMIFTGLAGISWFFWSKHQTILEKTIPAAEILISLEEQDCVLNIPESRILISWPDRVGMGSQGNVNVKFITLKDFHWNCSGSQLPDDFSFPGVYLESRLEIPDAELAPSDSLIQEFSSNPEKQFHWTVRFTHTSRQFQSSLWTKILIRKSQSENSEKLSIIDVENWSLLNNMLPMSVVSIVGIPSTMVYKVSAGIAFSGFLSFSLLLFICWHFIKKADSK